MSKRTRGSARAPHRRPGSRPTLDRAALRQRERPARLTEQAEPPDSVPTDDGAALVHENRNEAAAARAPLRGARSAHPRQRVKPGSLLASRAANEYVYVRQDMRRILLVGGLVSGILIALWLLIVVLRVIPLPFY